MSSRLLSGKDIDDDEIRATLDSCLEEVERLTAVVQGLLDLSRAETGQLELVKRTTGPQCLRSGHL